MKQGYYSIIGVSLLLFTFCMPTHAKNKSYLMVCKGGGNMRLDLQVDDKILDGIPRIRIYYKKSNRSGTDQSPAAGECSWMDRPISVKEPDTLQYNYLKNPLKSLTFKKGSIVVKELKHNNANRPGRTLINAILNGEKFFIHVKQNSNRGFDITKVGP